jgi:ATP-dependent protease HslVU (ClpYQ) peptidase subunit
MTCIVGWLHDGRVTIGGDSAAYYSYSTGIRQRVAPKVFANGPMVFGFCGSFRMGDLLQHALKVPDRKRRETVDAYLRTTFVDAVRACLKSGGFGRLDHGVETGGTFLVGFEGRLFSVEDDYQIAESADGFDAIGCAGELARGALAVLRNQRPGTARTKLRAALEVAARYSGAVAPPFAFVTGGARL